MHTLHKTYIIAEAGVNHNGSFEMAKQLIDCAVEAGVDAVKFQTFKADQLVSEYAPKADYQKQATDQNESQLEMLKKYELDQGMHERLVEICNKKNIMFLSTPFDLQSVDLLTEVIGLEQLKISSGDVTNAPLLLKAARSGKPVILSTGISSLGDVEQALAVLAFGYIEGPDTPSPGTNAFREAYISSEGQRKLKELVSLLHCTTEYPTPFEDVNLRAMDTLRAAFGLDVGLSDHSLGIAVPIAAVARGAKIIEKHFTLDRMLPGPDHQASLEPKELKIMVTSIREIEAALGSSIKIASSTELKNMTVVRKSIVANCKINKGESFSEENLTVKRSGEGITPIKLWDYIGNEATKDYVKDEVIRP